MNIKQNFEKYVDSFSLQDFWVTWYYQVAYIPSRPVYIVTSKVYLIVVTQLSCFEWSSNSQFRNNNFTISFSFYLYRSIMLPYVLHSRTAKICFPPASIRLPDNCVHEMKAASYKRNRIFLSWKSFVGHSKHKITPTKNSIRTSSDFVIFLEV